MPFIVIDGTDGSGKATQAGLLKKRIEDLGKEVATFDFPQYGTPSAAMVEAYLNGMFGKADEVSPKAASILFAIDRFAAKASMLEALKKGKIIISNRYVSSNMGHQAGKIADLKERERFMEWLLDLEYGIFGIPRPDLNIFLDVPPEIGQKLVDKKGNRGYVGGKKRDIHESDISHLKDAYASYISLAAKDPAWRRVVCVKEGRLMSKTEIQGSLWKIVGPLIT